MTIDLAKARTYVSGLDLKGTPRGILSQDAAADGSQVFIDAKNQAQVVGSGVFSFGEGVPATVREAIADSALLAQLVANKRVKPEVDPVGWFKEYSGVLQNVGWVLEEAGWSDYTTKGTAAEVNEKIIEVMAAAFVPGAAAAAIIMATVNALKAMEPGSSWFTIFNRETKEAKIARFQIGIVEAGTGASVRISLLGCLVEAKNTFTQVLFFKFKDAQATFQANSARVAITNASLTDLGPAIRTKVRAYQADYLSSITDL